MIISVVNHSNGLISDAELQAGLRAVNRQLAEDFYPNWGMTSTLRLHGSHTTATAQAAIAQAGDLKGDAVIYIWHPIDVPSALGFHARNHLGIPYGFVFPQISQLMGEPWTVGLSHEALEMTADPEVNRMVMGPSPTDPGRTVFHWYEVCDAVQSDTYLIDGVPVSNFVLPLYFTHTEEMGSRNDFLGYEYEGRTLTSFYANPGGYVGYFDPVVGEHLKYFVPGDTAAQRRLEVKQQLGLARRSVRYEFPTSMNLPVGSALHQFA